MEGKGTGALPEAVWSVPAAHGILQHLLFWRIGLRAVLRVLTLGLALSRVLDEQERHSCGADAQVGQGKR